MLSLLAAKFAWAAPPSTTPRQSALFQPGFLFESYDGSSFKPMTDGGVRTYANGSATDTGQTYVGDEGGYPYIMADDSRSLLLLHPGPGTGAPALAMASLGCPLATAGRFSVSGAFARANDAYAAGDGVRVFVLRNSTTLFNADIGSQIVVNATDPFASAGGVATFNLTIDAVAGDILRFVVSSGAQRVDGTFDVTALKMSINTNPTPATGVIGPAGGIVTGSNGEQLKVPPGTFASDTAVNLVSIDASIIESALGFKFVDRGLICLAAISVQTGGSTFRKPATLSVPVSADRPPATLSSILVFHSHPDLDGDGKPDLVLKDVGVVINGHIETSSDVSFPGIDSDGTFILAQTSFPVGLLSGQVLDQKGATAPNSTITTFELPFLFARSDAGGNYTVAVAAQPSKRRRAVAHADAGAPISDLALPASVPLMGTMAARSPNGLYGWQPFTLPAADHQLPVPALRQDQPEQSLLEQECKSPGVMKKGLAGLLDDIKDAIADLNFHQISFDAPDSVVLSCSAPAVELTTDLRAIFQPEAFAEVLPQAGTEYEQIKLLFGSYTVKLLTINLGPFGYIAIDEQIPPGVVTHGGSSISSSQRLTTTIHALADGSGVTIFTDVVLLSLKCSLNIEIEGLDGSCPLEDDLAWEVALAPKVVRVGPATVAVKGFDCPPVVLSFTADPPSINPGDTSVLTWTTTNASSVEIDEGLGEQGPIGLIAVSPSVTTQYTLTATGPGGTAIARTTVTVRDALPSLPVVSFTASPTSIESGHVSTLTWTTTNATSVSISEIGAGEPMSGSVQVSPSVTTTYTLTATGPGGVATAKATVAVNAVSGDLTGMYTGTYSLTQLVRNNCPTYGMPFTFSGPVTLSLVQTGSNLTGTVTFAGLKVEDPHGGCFLVDDPPLTAPVVGEVSGAALTLQTGVLFTGSVSGDTITMSDSDPDLPPGSSLVFTVRRVSSTP